MYAVCLRYAGNPEEAEDILQEDLLRSSKNWAVSEARALLKAGSEEYLSILQSSIFDANDTCSLSLKKKRIPWRAVICPYWTAWLKEISWN
jgi:hypothetical protein